MRRMYDKTEIKDIASEVGQKLYKHVITINYASSEMHFYNLDTTAAAPTGVSDGVFKFEYISSLVQKFNAEQIQSIISDATLGYFKCSGLDTFTGVGIISGVRLAGEFYIRGQMPIASENSDELLYVYISTSATNFSDTVFSL